MGEREYQFLKGIQNHENIIKVFGHNSGSKVTSSDVGANCSYNVASYVTNEPSIFSKSFDYMSMEYCSNGDLFDLVKRNGGLKEGLAKSLFLQLLEGVEFLHNKAGIAHLDLKLENILISKNNKLKICDFGFFE